MKQHVKKASIEAIVIVGLGFVIGLTVNTLSSTGLSIQKNHFHTGAKPVAVVVNTEQLDEQPSDITEIPSSESVNLTEEGLVIIPHDKLVELYESDAYFDERCIIIDARDDTHFLDGHIPGAFQYDHYRSERYCDAVLPACENAETVVIYCNGGECDDSKLAALDLIDRGVDVGKIRIYMGGAVAWRNGGLPLELNERLSDNLVSNTREES